MNDSRPIAAPVGLALVAITIALGLLIVAVCHPDRGRGMAVEYVIIGLALGTIGAHGTLAGTWTALGPFAFLYRLPLSQAWLFAVTVAFAINMAQGPGDHELIFIIALCLAGQWLLIQIPLWGLALYYGLRIEHSAGQVQLHEARFRQFGIRQLMVLTAAVAIVLGAGRLMVPWSVRSLGNEEVQIFIFLTVAGVITTLPLFLAVLLPRFPIISSLVVTALIAAVTIAELPLLNQLTGQGGRGGPDIGHIVAINGVQAAWIVVIAVLLRLGGYRLIASPAAAPS